MMNRKGQVLVVFVLILPLILLFLGLIIDIGNSLIIRKKYENIIRDVIVYNLKDYDEEQADISIYLIEKNIKNNIDDNVTINSKIVNNILEVSLKSNYKSIFSSIFNIGLNNININIKYDISNKKIVKE